MPFFVYAPNALLSFQFGLVRLWVNGGKNRKNFLLWFFFCLFSNISREIILIIQLHKLISIPHSIKELNKILLTNDDRPSVVIGMEAQTG